MSAIQHHFKRIQAELLREITWVIANKVNDPRVPKLFTVTEIKLAADTRNATVYISFINPEEIKDAIHALNYGAPFIQHCVAEKVKIKNFPKLYFKNDDSFERSIRINDILKKVSDDLV